MSHDTYVCPDCGAQSSLYWHSITPGLVTALIKVKHAVLAKGVNSIHTRKDMDGTPQELSKGEYGNFTRLRFHGLVAKDDDAGSGYWLLTKRGNAFLKGLEDIPSKVQTLNNRVTDHSETYVNVLDVMGSQPWFEDINDTERERVPVDVPQTELAL